MDKSRNCEMALLLRFCALMSSGFLRQMRLRRLSQDPSFPFPLAPWKAKPKYLHTVLSFHSVREAMHVQQQALLLEEISSQGLDSLSRIKLCLDQGLQTYVNQTQEMLMRWEFTTEVLLTGYCETEREMCYLSSSLNSSTSAQKFHVLVSISLWVVMN